MIYHHPFSGFSNFYRPMRKNYQAYYNYYSPHPQEFAKKNIKLNSTSSDEILKPNLNTCDDSCLFEFFGIKLFFDDILLLCLIFFLYNEGVKDHSLFIILILLFLS